MTDLTFNKDLEKIKSENNITETNEIDDQRKSSEEQFLGKKRDAETEIIKEGIDNPYLLYNN